MGVYNGLTRPFIGRPLPRVEDPRLLRGDGRYTDDLGLPNQAYAAFVRSPHAHARVRGIATDAARNAPGVLAVLTGADYLADGGRGILHAPVPADALQVDRPAFGGTPLTEPHLPLATGVVTYPGEAVAVVIADTPAAARDAGALVAVEYEVLPAVVEAVASGQVAVEGEFGDRAATEHALASADLVVEHVLRIQRIANAQLEPRAAIGSYDPDADRYLMIAGSQGVIRQRALLAAALNVAIDQVRVVCPDVGGGFGPRTALYPEQVVVTWAARRLGRPVRWTSDRSEAFLTDFQGRDVLASARLGLDRRGCIHALAADLVYNVGGRAVSYVPLANAGRVLTSVYNVPCAYVRVTGMVTNTVPTGPYRGAGRPEATFVIERLLDLAADTLGLDRLELRRRNVVPRDRLPYCSPLGLTYDSGAFLENMQRAIELADWAGFPARRAAARARGRLAGIGLANYIESPVGAPTECVKVSVLPDGDVEVIVGTQSSGQGHATVFAQVVADQLRVQPDRVRIVTGDSQLVMTGGGTHSDRSMRFVGALLVEACRHIREDNRRSAEASFTGRIPAFPTGSAVCELEIDPDTGEIDLRRYTCVDDVGQPINPLILHGQLHGGIVQGLGQALTEGVVYEPGTGQVLTGAFLDYALPTAAMLPTFTTELAEDPTAGNALRVKGAGESGTLPCLAAVVNAAADALGVSNLEMPLTPSRIWAALARR